MTAMKHSTVVTAPFSGNIVPLNKVPDETFASGVLGEGIAIEPSDGLFCSPVNGTVETIAGTKHAIGFVADGGLEILVHVGLEYKRAAGRCSQNRCSADRENQSREESEEKRYD